MNRRSLSSELAVSAIGYGAMGLSEFYGETNDANALRVLNKLIELGVNFIDTADLYGRGHNERLIGHFLSGLSKSARAELRIATKCGIVRSPDESYARTINNSPDYIRRCCPG